MTVRPQLWHKLAIAFLGLLAGLAVRSDAPPVRSTRMALLPRVTLWSWERRENLSGIDPSRVAIAYLAQTLTIGFTVSAQPRREPLVQPASAISIPVVRIETAPGAVLNSFTRWQAAEAIAATARTPGIAALQIDFDATRSQRAFYRDLLFDVRREMPADLPLSMTALASWCSYDRWLGGLPVDEAVPMYFRMEPDRRRAAPDNNDFKVREPLCRESIGVSTTEPWPAFAAGKRVYIFSDRGWRSDLDPTLKRRLQ